MKTLMRALPLTLALLLIPIAGGCGTGQFAAQAESLNAPKTQKEYAAKCDKGDFYSHQGCFMYGEWLRSTGRTKEAKAAYQKGCDEGFSPSCDIVKTL